MEKKGRDRDGELAKVGSSNRREERHTQKEGVETGSTENLICPYSKGLTWMGGFYGQNGIFCSTTSRRKRG